MFEKFEISSTAKKHECSICKDEIYWVKICFYQIAGFFKGSYKVSEWVKVNPNGSRHEVHIPIDRGL